VGIATRNTLLMISCINLKNLNVWHKLLWLLVTTQNIIVTLLILYTDLHVSNASQVCDIYRVKGINIRCVADKQNYVVDT